MKSYNSSKVFISSAQFLAVRFYGALVILDQWFCDWLKSSQFTADSLDFLEVFPLLSSRQPWRFRTAVIVGIQGFMHHCNDREKQLIWSQTIKTFCQSNKGTYTLEKMYERDHALSRTMVKFSFITFCPELEFHKQKFNIYQNSSQSLTFLDKYHEQWICSPLIIAILQW